MEGTTVRVGLAVSGTQYCMDTDCDRSKSLSCVLIRLGNEVILFQHRRYCMVIHSPSDCATDVGSHRLHLKSVHDIMYKTNGVLRWCGRCKQKARWWKVMSEVVSHSSGPMT